MSQIMSLGSAVGIFLMSAACIEAAPPDACMTQHLAW
jgi:hypothetical protein